MSPARCAASTFCFRPPIGSTRPCNVTSPVMPTPGFTGRPVSKLASAVVIVMPADGPSFGHRARGHVQVEAPVLERVGAARRARRRCARTNDSAICADSDITSPS